MAIRGPVPRKNVHMFRSQTPRAVITAACFEGLDIKPASFTDEGFIDGSKFWGSH